MKINVESLVGLKMCKRFKVYKKYIAKSIGSGGVEVLSTPSLISFMESVSYQLLQDHLPRGYTSVGIEICIKHKAPVILGEYVDVYSIIESVEGRKVVFNVSSYHGDKLVGDGRHVRYIVEIDKFMRKAVGT
jgi:predicted thioesterase